MDKLLVLSDYHGFIDVYLAQSDIDAIVSKKENHDFLVQEFPLSEGQTENAWMVIYRDIEAVAFASNSREEAMRVQTKYAKVGLVYTDEIDYWMQPIGIISPLAAKRLNPALGDNLDELLRMESKLMQSEPDADAPILQNTETQL